MVLPAWMISNWPGAPVAPLSVDRNVVALSSPVLKSWICSELEALLR